MKLLKTIQLKCGQTYLMRTDDGNILEVGDVFMSVEKEVGTRPYHFEDFDNPSDLNKRVMTVCVMSGCCQRCKFCHCGEPRMKKTLNKWEIVGQVEFMIEQGILNGRHPNPKEAKEFRILFTRMGEPFMNWNNVHEAIVELKEKYPNLIVGLSTSITQACKDTISRLLLDKIIAGSEKQHVLDYSDIQISMHSTSDIERQHIFGYGFYDKTSVASVMYLCNEVYNLTNKAVGLNFILFKGYTYDFKSLLKDVDKEKIWVRLSPFNTVENEHGLVGLLTEKDCEDKKPSSSQELIDIIKNLDESGIPYSYAPAIDEEVKHNVACGQALVNFNIERKSKIVKSATISKKSDWHQSLTNK